MHVGGGIRRRSMQATLMVALVLALTPAAASAGGRMILTGHDADWRCGVIGSQCHFIQVAVNYVRNGAPDPAKPLLVLDNADLQLKAALVGAFGPSILSQIRVVSPRAPQFQGLNLSVTQFSAILVASDQTCGNDGNSF